MKSGPLHFDIQIHYCSYFEGDTWVFDQLNDPYWRIYRHTVPGEWMSYNGRPYTSDPDILTIIPPFTPFTAHGRGTPHHFYIHFQAGFPYNLTAPGLFTYKPSRQELGFIDRTQALFSTGKELPSTGLLDMVRLAAAVLQGEAGDSARKQASDPRIALIEAYMREHLHEPIANHELAELSNMAVNSFNRLFRTITGFSPQQYFTRLKVEQSCLLLSYGELSIDEVADQLGFNDRYYFSRVFKKVMGCGPAMFRKQGLS